MLTRLCVDNFRCFVNFQFNPARRQLILGSNGSGKSSLLDAVLFLRQFVAKGDSFDDLFLGRRTRWLNQSHQTFELDVTLDGSHYVYRLVVEPFGEIERARVASETVHFDGNPIFQFVNGEVRLYTDEFVAKAAYELDPQRSALATIMPRPDHQKLNRYKQWISSLYCFRINPFAMVARTETENLYPNVDLSNLASWYRHLVQFEPTQNAALLEDLRSCMDGFRTLKLDPFGENVRALAAEFASDGTKGRSFYLNELSDGQRCLICLYIILRFVLANGSTVILDEPDNFISLREIQPWLTGVSDVLDEGMGQAILISHHPEVINQWAPGSGVQFVRDQSGAARVEEFHGDSDAALAPAELIARGWERD